MALADGTAEGADPLDGGVADGAAAGAGAESAAAGDGGPLTAWSAARSSRAGATARRTPVLTPPATTRAANSHSSHRGSTVDPTRT
ncbi:hypothetical protein AB0D97_28640 [Streptomyces roseus]|uniref:hypothetical protein n=1 Tax=Streptomyces roseus TaxID=66430 RepID=UPI0033E9E3D0